jgi:hypothetical protein
MVVGRGAFLVIPVALSLSQPAVARPCAAQTPARGDDEPRVAPLPSRAIVPNVMVTVLGSIITESHAAVSSRDQRTIELLPALGRNFTDILITAPGVQAARTGLSIHGSAGPENRDLVNGVATNDIITGVSTQPIRLDFVEQIQVRSSSYRAEHGASMGGAVAVITRSGGNSVHGFAGIYCLDPRFRWSGAHRPETRISPVDNLTPEVFVSRTEANTRSPDHEGLGDLGGPEAEPSLFSSHEKSLRIGSALTAAVTPRLRARVTTRRASSTAEYVLGLDHQLASGLAVGARGSAINE